MNISSICNQMGWNKSGGSTAWQIFDEGGVQFGSFQLKNPELSPSPIKFNLRTPLNGGTLLQTTINRIGTELFIASSAVAIAFDLVVGIPRAG